MIAPSKKNIEDFELFIIPIVKKCIAVGYVARLSWTLAAYEELVRQSDRSDFIETFHEARSWLREAERHEAVFGAGSLYNREHPIVLEAMRRRARRQIPGINVASSVSG
jgi:cob(I)alamin adenosyltransferase